MKVLVAGASGTLGQQVTRELSERGYQVRAISRSRRCAYAHETCFTNVLASDITHVMEGIELVFSCLGASVIPRPQYGRASFDEVDVPANRKLLHAAREAGVRKFGYVAVFGAERLMHSPFVNAHERVVEEIKGSGMSYVIIRPTGFFGSMCEILGAASLGLHPRAGKGEAVTNPIHEADLAEFCVEALLTDEHTQDLSIGGPEILTRRQIAHFVKGGNGLQVPSGLLRLGSLAYRPFNRRVSELMSFIADILPMDLVAPSYGTRRFAEYVRAKEKGSPESIRRAWNEQGLRES